MKLFGTFFMWLFYLCNYFSQLYYHYWRKLLPGSVPRATTHHTAVTILLELDVLKIAMSQYLKFSS